MTTNQTNTTTEEKDKTRNTPNNAPVPTPTPELTDGFDTDLMGTFVDIKELDAEEQVAQRLIQQFALSKKFKDKSYVAKTVKVMGFNKTETIALRLDYESRKQDYIPRNAEDRELLAFIGAGKDVKFTVGALPSQKRPGQYFYGILFDLGRDTTFAHAFTYADFKVLVFAKLAIERSTVAGKGGAK